ncbi:MAG: hypothetical protein CMJ29_13495 [Phycisphaerae bacterium]|nr:hypothetical protein [Phycisphaerae bacterium]
MTERDRNVRIANTGVMISQMRRLGVKLVNGFFELVDNSSDADSRTIWTHLDSGPGPWRLIVADDGCGIPEHFQSDDPEIPPGTDGIVHALRYGGRIPLPTIRPSTGRFGFGLTQTSFCLCDRTVAYSKTPGGKWRRAVLDVERLLANRGEIDLDDPRDYDPDCGTPPEEHLPPNWREPRSGTIIVMESIVRPGWKDSRPLIKRMRRDIGRVYRDPIASGLHVFLSSTCGSPDGDGSMVEARDPMMALAGTLDAERFGPPLETRGPIEIILDGRDLKGSPEVIDPSTGLPAVIRIEMAVADPQSVTSSLNLSDSASGRSSRILSEHWFSSRDQGFSIVRGDRELARGLDLGLYTKTSNMNWFRGEIRFPVIPSDQSTYLDGLFGVRTDKTNVDIDKRLVDSIRGRIGTMITQLRTSIDRHRRSRSRSRTMRKPVVRMAELHSSRLRPLSPRRSRRAEQIQSLKERRIEREKQIISEVDSASEARVARAATRVSEARATGVAKEIAYAEKEEEKVRMESESSKRIVRNRFQHDAFFRRMQSPLGSDEIYLAEDFHDQIWVTLNESTPFFRELYEDAAVSSGEPEVQSLLDLMLFSIAFAEKNDYEYHSEEYREFWTRARRDISRIANILVGKIGEEFGDDGPDPNEGNQRPHGDTITRALARVSVSAKVDPPESRGSRRDGGTITKDWLVSVANFLEVDVDGARKQDVVRRILAKYSMPVLEDVYFSTGSTVTLPALHVIEDICLGKKADSVSSGGFSTMDLSSPISEADFDAMIEMNVAIAELEEE